MSSFTNLKVFSVGVAWAWAWRSRGLSPLLVMFMNKVNFSRAHAQVRVLWLQRFLLSDVALCCVRNRQAFFVQLAPDKSPESDTPNLPHLWRA
jgi:hypothetical protein